jgi:uncharacterized protein YcaQ
MALYTQFLTMSNGASPVPTPDTIVDLVTALGYVQIDTLHVGNRAHYVTIQGESTKGVKTWMVHRDNLPP